MRVQKVKQLLESGVSTKLLSTLSDKQINLLHKRMVSEVTKVSKDDSTTIKKMEDSKQPYEVYEDDQLDQDIQNKEYGDTDQDEKQQGPSNYGNNSTNDRKMDSDDVDGMGMMEAKKKTKTQNPYAICTSQLGKEFKTKERSEWSPKQMAKYERCVKDVKESLKEGKKPLLSLIENELMYMVEKHITPKITKNDLLQQIKEGGIIKRELKKRFSPIQTKKMDKSIGKSYLAKKDMTEQPEPVKTPTKPTTVPGVKPKRPNPYQPPKTTPKESPKAQEPSPVKTPTKPTTTPGVKPKRPNPYQPPKTTPKEAPKAEELKKMFMQTLTSMFNK